MAVKRMDNVLIVVEDLDAVTGFFVEIGLSVVGRTTVEGSWVDTCIGLEDARADIVMLQTPDGHGRVELSRFHRPAAVPMQPANPPSNALGMRRVMFAVDDVDELVARLRDSHGAELVGGMAQYEDQYRMCFVRGPEGLVVGLAQELG